MTRLTAMLIKYNDDIRIDSARHVDSGMWLGMVNLWKDGELHIAPLIDSQPVFATREDAEGAMQALVDAIRSDEAI